MVRLVGCIIAIIIVSAVIGIAAVRIYQKKVTIKGSIGMWMLLAFLVRIGITIVFSFSEKSTHTDMVYWIRWTEFFSQHRFHEYYSLHAGDYTPGFMYWLKLAATILTITGQGFESMLAQLLYKLPAMTLDCVAGLLVYRCAKLKTTEETHALTCAVLYMFHPTVIFLSAVWGQVDIIYTILIAVTFYLLHQDKIVFSAFTIALAILIKLQTIFVGPVYIVAILLYLFGKTKVQKEFANRLKTVVLATITGLGTLILGCLPGGIADVFVQVTRTMSQYQKASLNAANFWTLVGQNMQSQERRFCGITLATYGYLFLIIAIVLVVWFAWTKGQTEAKNGIYYALGGWMYLFVFTFTVRMHERYVYPALLLFLCAYAIQAQKEYYVWFSILSITCFVNFVAFITIEKYETPFQIVLWITSIAVVAVCVYSTYRNVVKCKYE